MRSSSANTRASVTTSAGPTSRAPGSPDSTAARSARARVPRTGTTAYGHGPLRATAANARR
ncbi:hypothetical protein [Micromonospora sp. CPCC 205561]|uniref:hypothetical protein n=1 Tax=Micromonospora sp. CPCC 205561 TaxID=3122407 RepID=UPI002FF25E9A